MHYVMTYIYIDLSQQKVEISTSDYTLHCNNTVEELTALHSLFSTICKRSITQNPMNT